jgi:hypothetical protein
MGKTQENSHNQYITSLSINFNLLLSLSKEHLWPCIHMKITECVVIHMQLHHGSPACLCPYIKPEDFKWGTQKHLAGYVKLGQKLFHEKSLNNLGQIWG